ncbi:LuxR C-terminal-related transcriptional regulator [Rarobacter incanus]|uniref:LuxR family two component transcriptional regulator n=1 Tax=Rarobacter incanus TaxID=153494 RepID=A0A542SR79_9MICO|nr:response regulator transcription factor [Rarobacter incanus]TQK77130.1 LuxR family two component transcriptional regulator [Rarobacter incanus]
MSESLRLVVVDDHAMFRAGVVSLLPDDFEVVGQAADVESAIAIIGETAPDVVLLDVHLPGGAGGGGAEVAAAVAATRSPGGADVRMLALSVSDAAQDVVSVIRAGARGYVTKSIEPVALADAIRRVAAGDAVFSPMLAGFVLDSFGSQPVVPERDAELDRLSAREQEVMRLIARGYSYREVAGDLFISVKTVETHVSAVLRKLQLSSRHEITRWAAARRLL